MKISKKLPQFEGKNGLIIVCSSQEADFYLAHDGQVDKLLHFKLEKPKFSDREDYASRGSRVFESGAKIESVKKEERINFAKTFKEETKQLASEYKVDAVYLFAPSTICKDLQKILPVVLKKKLILTLNGNFQKDKLDDILKKVVKKPLK